MIGVIDVAVQAANISMPLYPLRAFVNSPSSLRIRNVPKRIGDWNLTSVQLVAAYPDNTIKTAECKLIGCVWVGTIDGSTTTGTSENGYTIYASGTDENGNEVSNYILGKGLVEILDTDGSITPGQDTAYVHLLDEEPTTPKEGDMWQDIDHIWYIYQDGSANRLDEATAAGLNDVAALAHDAYDVADTALLKANDLELLVPAQATTQNQLADKAFVNSSVQTATANFRGNWPTWDTVPESLDVDLYPPDYTGSKVPTVNDYLVVQDASEYGEQQTLEGTWRFKYSGTWTTDGKNGWLPEYQVNETPMTAAQLAAINSNITAAKVSQYDEALTHIQSPDYSLVTITPTTTTGILPSIFPITLENEGYPETILEDEVDIDYWDGDIYLVTQHFTPGTEDNICVVDGTTGKYKYSEDFADSLRFNGVEPTTDTQVVETTTNYNLQNRAINTISVDASISTYNLEFPSAVQGKARDFIIRAVASAGTYSTPPTLSASGVTLMNAEGTMPEIATDENAAKTTLIYFSEIASNVFLVKGEQLETIS